MTKTSSSKILQKVAMAVAALVFIAFATWLYFNQQKINYHSNTATQLSFSQANASLLQLDIDRLLGIITEHDEKALTEFIEQRSTQDKEWLTSLLLGAESTEPLAIFAQRYLSALVQIQVSSDTQAPTNHHKLLRLIEDVSLAEENIIYLSQQRMLANLSQLNISIALSNILLLCLMTIFMVMIVINYSGFIYQASQTRKYQRLSLYFSDHPNMLLRISSNGRIKYFNKSAENFLKQQQLDKYKLLPPQTNEYIKQSIAEPKRTILYQHQIANNLLNCDMRFCKESQQIFISLTQEILQQQPEVPEQTAAPIALSN